jgi:hypothetical protein
VIVSHKHQFIFAKTRKTAGTSIEVFLEPLCGEKDVVTPVSPRYQDSETETHRPRNQQGYSNHAPAVRIRELVGDSVWNGYYKFSVERNPWDKMVSMYWWRKYQYKIEDDFPSFCRKAIESPDNIYTCPSDYHFYTIDSELCVDKVIQFETLLDDFSSVCEHLNLGEVTSLPRAKAKIRSEKKHYSEYYDDELRQLVAERFRKEIDLFGYEF